MSSKYCGKIETREREVTIFFWTEREVTISNWGLWEREAPTRVGGLEE